MKKQRNLHDAKLIVAGLAAMTLLSACSSLKVPNFDKIKFPEFREEAENIGNYPRVEDAPEEPTGLRTDKQWDAAAKRIMAKRDGFEPVAEGQTLTDAEIEAEIERLTKIVEEYKLDDPQ